MEQRRFARSRLTHQGDEFSLANFQIQIVEDHDLLVAGAENLRKIHSPQKGLSHWIIGSLSH
jgi:hypothetical protein